MKTLDLVVHVVRSLILVILFASSVFSQTTVRVYSFHDEDNIRDSYGSGWLITNTQVITAYHVIHGCREGNKQVQVRFSDGWRSWGTVEDVNLYHDIALIWINPHKTQKPSVIGEVPNKGEVTLHGYGYDYEYAEHKGTIGLRMKNGLLDNYKGKTPESFLRDQYSRRRGISKDSRDGPWQIVNVVAIPGDSGGPVTFNGKVIGVVLAISDEENPYTIICRIDTIQQSFGDKLRNE